MNSVMAKAIGSTAIPKEEEDAMKSKTTKVREK
jgi:hypothetical protein